MTPDMETQIRFMLTSVRMGSQRRYQTWFAQRYLFTPESETLVCDLIRFICCAIHPTNQILQSDICPRWAIVGWLLKCCKSNHVESNAKLALFYDWLFFTKVDNIMNIEPAILLMVHSIPKYVDMTHSLLEFLFLLVENYDPIRRDLMLKGVTISIDVLVGKGVVRSLEPLSASPHVSLALREKLTMYFPSFCRPDAGEGTRQFRAESSLLDVIHGGKGGGVVSYVPAGGDGQSSPGAAVGSETAGMNMDELKAGDVVDSANRKRRRTGSFFYARRSSLKNTLFDLSLDVEEAEQEYHLQAELPSRPGSHPLARAVGFAFGGEHLWDRFTVFILFSNGSIYVLCPVVPFGSMFNGAAIDELNKDAMHFTLPSSTRDSTVVRNASLALAWLESVFTGFAAWSESTGKEPALSSFMLKAHAHVPLDASVLLQGPLPITGSVAKQAENIAYTVVGSDSILAVSGKDSCVHLYGVDDEMQPMWNTANPPRLTVDDEGHILSVGMLAQVAEKDQPSTSTSLISISNQHGDSATDEDASTPWTGQPAPLVGLADVELSLQASVLSSAPISLFVDPVVPERLYCHHAAGMDAIILQWLPFSDDSLNKRFTGDPLPSLVPLLDTCPSNSVAPSALLGVAALLDPLGETWLVAITSRGDCAVVEVKPQRLQASPLFLEGSKQSDDAGADAGVFQTMSRELLLGPKDIPIPQMTSSGTPLTVDSIEGRAFLHDQCKLLHEKYVQYAHRVHVELTSFGTRLYQNVEDQHRRLQQVQDRVKQAQRGTGALAGRIEQALEKTWQLEQRVKTCSNLPGLRQKPLTEAELNFKSELDAMRFQNHEIFRSVIDVLSDRCERVLAESEEYARGSSESPSRMSSPGSRKMTPFRGKSSTPVVSSSQMCHLKAAVEQLVGRVATTISNLDLVDDSLQQRERLSDR